MPSPITGNTYVCVGYTTQLFDITSGGTWTSSDNTKATVDGSGLVTGVAIGAVTITYTQGTAVTFAMNVVPVQISNGFNLSRIYPALTGRIGWRQPTASGSPTLSADVQTSTSGRYWNEGHELATVNNIYQSQEDSAISDAGFSTYLLELDNQVAMRCMNAIFNRPAFIEHRLCYERLGFQQNVPIPKTPTGAACGYRITVAAGDYAIVFNTISLLFNGVATFNIYLFNDLIAAPVKSISVTTVANSQVKYNLDWATNYITQNNNGGIWYICYFDNELPAGVQAIDEQLNLWENSMIWGGTPFTSPKTGTLDFNRRYVGTVFYSYGLNVEMSSYRDYTQVIVQNPQLFDEVRILTYAITAIGIIKGSLRTGGAQAALENKKEQLNTDMNLAFPTEEFPFVSGLKQQLARAIKTIADSFRPKLEVGSYPCTGGTRGMAATDYYEGFDINNMPARQTLT